MDTTSMMAHKFALLLLLATGLLFLGHVARAVRWALLFPPNYLSKRNRFDLLLGLSIGYAANVFLPLRAGELLRALFVTGRGATNFSYVAATIVAERFTDLLVISVIIAIIVALQDTIDIQLFTIGAFMLAISLASILFVIVLRRSFRLRHLMWTLSSLFNDSLRLGIIEFFWSFSEMLLAGKVANRSYVIATILMWSIYSLSYLCFGYAIGETVQETFYSMLGSPLQPLLKRIFIGDFSQALPFLVYTILPVFVVIIYGFTKQWSGIVRDIAARIRYGNSITHSNISARERFKQDNEYNYFLASLFSGSDNVLSSFALQAMEDGVLQRIYNGGSDAITTLVEVNQRLLIRKFAIGAAADKLQVQANWLNNFQDSHLPLAHIIAERRQAEFYRYDMPLVVPTNDFYDVIHTLPIEHSKVLLKDIVEHISGFHRHYQSSVANKQIVTDYFNEKVKKNTTKILDFAEGLLTSNTYRINGKDYDLSTWQHLLDNNWLNDQIHDFRTSTIHGDLTIENIIIAPNAKNGFYLIDPNPDNIFNTPLIDFAKLMQSLHLGYESLNRGRLCTMHEDNINLTLTRSRAYSDLQDYFEQLLLELYGADTLREIYFHELINYLRLTPYKIRKNPADGLTFFASTSIILDSYLAQI